MDIRDNGVKECDSINIEQNDYHFLWFPDERSIFSKGETIHAYSMLEALVEFERRHNTEPYYVTQSRIM